MVDNGHYISPQHSLIISNNLRSLTKLGLVKETNNEQLQY